MLKISKVPEPPFYKDFIAENAPKSWDDLTEIKERLREFILTHEQTIADVSLCTYCERKVALVSTHIDHVKPKAEDKFPELFSEYSNLTVSCNSKNSCGHKKGKEYDERFIHPVVDNPEDFLSYEVTTGKIIPTEPTKKERVARTCEILGLNSSHELVGARKRVLNLLYTSFKKGNDISRGFKDFPSLVRFFQREFVGKRNASPPCPPHSGSESGKLL